MAKTQVIQSNFTAGEISPRLYGRVDIEKYQNAAKTMRDVIPVQHGGARRRDGTRYIATVKDSADVTRLIPFIYSKDEAYVLEFGDQYMRVYRNGAQVLSGGVPYEIATPYTSAMLYEIDYTQGEDTVFIFHKDVFPRRLRRFAHDYWVLRSAPIDPEPFLPRGENPNTTLTLAAASGGSVDFTSGVALWRDADIGRVITYQGGVATISSITSVTVAVCSISTTFPATSIAALAWNISDTPVATLTPSATGPIGAAITLTLSVSGWHGLVVGHYYVRVNGGLCLITSLDGVDDKIANAVVLKELTGTTAAPVDSWTLEGKAWSYGTGSFPKTGTIHEQRLICGGTEVFPQTIWGSKIGDYFDFTIGTDDDEAFSFKIASDQANPIAYLASARTLICLTSGGEFTIEGGVEKPITPTNVQIRVRSNRGCAQVRPLRVENEEFFVHRSGKKLLAFGYSAQAYDWAVSDVALFSEHMITPGVTELAYQQDPDPIIYAKRSDGDLAVCAFSREQDVSGWVRWNMNGLVKSMAVIPTSTGEQCYLIVQRVINGATVQHVEVITTDLFLDAAITGTSGPGATVWTGLGHLEGETVGVIADGYYAGEFEVASAQITLLNAANAVTIGLTKVPTIEPLTPEIGGGFAQGNSVRVGEVSLRFLDTKNCQVNGDEIDFRQFGDSLLDQPLPSFTGLKRIENLGWDRGDTEMTITAQYPFSFHLLSLIRKITVND